MSGYVRHAYERTRRSLTGVAPYAILLTQGFALTVSIDLGNNNFVFGMCKRIREFFILWC